MATRQSAPTVETLQRLGDSDGCLRLIDQTLLPGKLEYIDCTQVTEVWEAIRQLRVRGAPAIGIAAAYGVCLAVQGSAHGSSADVLAEVERAVEYLSTSRPTAVNLFWALERLREVTRSEVERLDGAALVERLLVEARQIHEEDRQMCHAIGRHGAELLGDQTRLLTHCNAGGLATAEYGTALSVMFTAQDLGKQLHVFVDETRPLLQGARLTAWELMQREIPCTLICDSMAAQVMAERRVDAVITGADRIAANGDAANKIGTYSLAVLAHYHGIPFYVAAPSSTFDLQLEDGSRIPIEQRAAEEITRGFGRPTAPDHMDVYNPAFDVTPAKLIHTIITEKGCIHPVTRAKVRTVLRSD